MTERELFLIRISVTNRALDKENEIQRTVEAIDFCSRHGSGDPEICNDLRKSLVTVKQEVSELNCIYSKLFHKEKEFLFV